MNTQLAIAVAIVALVHIVGGITAANTRTARFLAGYAAACVFVLLAVLPIIPPVGIVGLIAWGFLIRYLVTTYNRLMTLSQDADLALHDTAVAQQRRQSIVPRLEAFAAGYSSHERQTFVNTVLARGARGSLAVFEAHPVLRASEGFQRLMHELVLAEDEIRNARLRHNAAVRAYNTTVTQFPTLLLARLLGFNARPFFHP